MQVQGIHLLLTYKCNARCRHCFLSAGPERAEVFPLERASRLVDQAASLSSVNHLFIEGGEPFLYPHLMEALIRRATGAGLWVGALTNGFWAVSDERAAVVLKPLVKAGLKSLSISTDAWHEEFVSPALVRRAANVATKIGLDVDVMVCRAMKPAPGEIEELETALAPTPVYAGGIVGRGRAASAICLNGARAWESLTTCREDLQAPGRVHIGPGGEVHLCQGLLLGAKVGEMSLDQVFSGYLPRRHPIVAPLIEGGPAALARYAVDYGFKPRGGYVDGCQLCFEVRAFLRDRFPAELGPGFVYAA